MSALLLLLLIWHKFGCHRSESENEDLIAPGWDYFKNQNFISEFRFLFLLIINVEKRIWLWKYLLWMIIQAKTQILGTEPSSDFFCPWSVLFKETIDFCHYAEETHVRRWPKNLPLFQFSRILSKGRSTSFGLAHEQLCWK